MKFEKRHDTTDTTDFCLRQLVTDLLRTCYGETGEMDFGRNHGNGQSVATRADNSTKLSRTELRVLITVVMVIVVIVIVVMVIALQIVCWLPTKIYVILVSFEVWYQQVCFCDKSPSGSSGADSPQWV